MDSRAGRRAKPEGEQARIEASQTFRRDRGEGGGKRDTKRTFQSRVFTRANRPLLAACPRPAACCQAHSPGPIKPTPPHPPQGHTTQQYTSTHPHQHPHPPCTTEQTSTRWFIFLFTFVLPRSTTTQHQPSPLPHCRQVTISTQSHWINQSPATPSPLGNDGS